MTQTLPIELRDTAGDARRPDWMVQRCGFDNIGQLYRAIASNAVPKSVYWRVGRRLRFSAAKVEAWIAEGGSPAPSSAQQRTA